MDRDLTQKVVVITGASSGFGKGAASAFAAAGARVVLAARRGDLIKDLAAECGGARQALALATDVSNCAEVQQLALAALAQFGRIDVWINNAGVGVIGPFEAAPIADHVQVIETDLLGTIYGAYYAYHVFLEQRQGILINIASELGAHSVPYYSSYAAAKHGIVGFSDSLRQEVQLKQLDDIHICTVLPTAHDTPFFDHAANYSGRELQAPLPLHDPQDVVDALVRLARDPRDREVVGADGVVKLIAKAIAPGLTDKIAAQAMQTSQHNSPPAAATSGAVHRPTKSGSEVSAGRLRS